MAFWGKCVGILFIGCLPLSVSVASETAKVPAVLQEAHDSLVELPLWKFQPDRQGRGLEQGWAATNFNDSQWPTLKANAPWQAQGFAGYNGSGWYRAHMSVPAGWRGSKVILHSEGVQDEYDLYVNGTFVRHFGSMDLPTDGVPTNADIAGALAYGKDNLIALRVKGYHDNSGVNDEILVRRVPPFANYRNLLPSPVFDAHPELVNLYWDSWRMAWEKVSFGNSSNGFVPAYMDEGYNEQIYQWDSIFMTMYGRYGRRLFPAIQTLDNFYVKQESDGYIQRIYSQTTGKKLLDPGIDFTVTNPPLFAWAEWDYFRLTGDASRLPRVLKVLGRYDAWIMRHQSSSSVPGMLWQTGFDSGMDNMPRPNAELAGWVDATAEQALAAKYLAKIAGQIGQKTLAKYWRAQFEQRKANVNKWSWSEADGFYYDVDKTQKQTGVRHIGAYWTLLAGIADKSQAARLVGHLKNPLEFYRKHLFPALSASDPGFTEAATYWAGGVWAPTNYMTIRGLTKYGYTAFAREAAMNHLQQMAAVYSSAIDLNHIDPNEASSDYRTIWECYNPDFTVPCTRADTIHYGRQDFAGWTALGPITLLIEQAIGLEIIGADNHVIWHLRENGRVGLQNFDLGKDNLVNVLAGPLRMGKRLIEVTAQKAFSLTTETRSSTRKIAVHAGYNQFEVKDSEE